jgi:hypothetical protein
MEKGVSHILKDKMELIVEQIEKEIINEMTKPQHR